MTGIVQQHGGRGRAGWKRKRKGKENKGTGEETKVAMMVKLKGRWKNSKERLLFVFLFFYSFEVIFSINVRFHLLYSLLFVSPSLFILKLLVKELDVYHRH